ncbi:ferredoxin reductase [Gordonia sp. 852002-50816_SCH5313054-c]|uniref:ferredoxin reductase n=1 Tax=unclassified Gordonia (in: high G+C Gram-positive bacteria) TaxID=2657482 RepID=UPI0007EB22C3|nr:MULTISPECIES: ferredoxin reductase [unclassified Gordonia (in: high G+C Gram-positive bacteria)]OBC09030.1 ferredoxin reductase [Gordonia sp. 852002-50816_SCH5313054-a]OBC21470.1 ferredoxin reductase [Gordonia sp. 852002-50816_SCH5313054-c]
MSIRLPEMIGSVVEAGLSPHPVDRYLELLDPMITWRDLRAKVVDVTRPTSRTVRITLAPTRQWRGHRAGQFIQLKVVIDGVRHVRCFSPANAQGHSDVIELTITAHDDGFVSTYLRDNARVGDVYGLEQADGDFVLPRSPAGPVVFISGGSGVTPTLSMLRTLVASAHSGPITFIHYARTPDDVAYATELNALAAAHSNVDVRLRYTRGAHGDLEAGHFTTGHLDDIALDDADVFVCGPSTLMDAVIDHLADAHPTARVHSESFRPAPAAIIDPDEPISGDVAFTTSGKVAANDGRTILDQAESAGLSPKSGCRMGICFSCTAVKKSGCTRNVLTGDIDSEADKQIQLCINAPVGDVEIEV